MANAMQVLCRSAFSRRRLLVGAAYGLFAQIMPAVVSGQNNAITFDSSFGSVSLPADFGQGGNYQIQENYGLRSESNLFHSFDEFAVPTSGSAIFEIGVDVLNVISRVTGGSPSEIDGRISIADGNGNGANFWMINPAGMMFGPNTVIDVGGAFNAGAADYLTFSETGDLIFSVFDDSVNLLVANPLEFGFLETGVGDGGLSLDGIDITFEENRYTGISLTGRDVSIRSAYIQSFSDTAVSGDMRIVGERTLTFADTNIASLASSESRGGDVSLTSENISLDNSSILLGTFWSGDSGSLTINALDTVGLTSTQLFAETSGAGNAGLISIQGDKLLLNSSADGAQLEGTIRNLITSTSGFGVADGSASSFGAAGTVLLTGNSVVVANTGFEATTRSDRLENFPGVLSIIAIDGDITLLDTSLETSAAGASSAGNIFIEATGMVLAENTLIKSDTTGAGNAGSVSVSGADIQLRNAATIASQTFGSGNAGAIYIIGGSIQSNSSAEGTLSENSETVTLTSRSGFGGADGTDANFGAAGDLWISGDSILLANTGLEASTGSDRIENKVAQILIFTHEEGRLTLEESLSLGVSDMRGEGDIGDLTILNSVLETSTLGASDAGNIFLSGKEFHVGAGTKIKSEAFASGEAGFLNLAAKSLTVDSSLIRVSAFASGDAGEIAISADDIVFRDAATVSAETVGAGNAGDIDIAAERITVDRSSVRAATFAAGDAGDVGITANEIVFLDSTNISAETFGAGDAGSVLIQGDSIRSNISSDGVPLESAGRVEIVSTSGFDVTDGSAAGFGASGDVLLTGNSIVLVSTNLEASTRSDRVENRVGQILIAGNSSNLSLTEIEEALESGSIVEGNSSNVTLIDIDLEAETFGLSDASDIFLIGGELILTNETKVDAGTVATGDAGNILIRGGTMVLSEGSVISSEASAAGAAGSIDIKLGGFLEIRGSSSEGSGVTTNAAQSQGGDISISTTGRLNMFIGIVRASAGADGNGGDVKIIADSLLMQRSAILARAQNGNGGKLDFDLTGKDKLYISGSFSQLNADSDTGNAGEITINAPDANLNSALQEQETNFVAAPQLAADACGPAATSSLSTFSLNDEGGTPVSPDRYLSASADGEVNALSAGIFEYDYDIPGAVLAAVHVEYNEECR